MQRQDRRLSELYEPYCFRVFIALETESLNCEHTSLVHFH